jgi:valyl-tRNA synthetase
LLARHADDSETMTIDKTYQPAAVERRIYDAWEAAGAFRAGRPERAKAAPYCIVIPPPNVTGSLHMGHALNNTLQDILCRFERMRGKDVLWQPGTDHAGIATQAVVERQLMERQQPGSRAMGREAFIKRVWEWKAESGGIIIDQLKRLGASCDWSRERFTMDEGLSRAVMKVFVTLYREGLIYKDKRLVNWDPKLKTAISDLEVVQVETKGHLWHLRYPIEGKTFDANDPTTFIVVATTRPETMLGDTAVAVHPQNERLKHLIGKTAIVPLVGRRIPVIGDEYADPEKGSGAVKITPAHDFNDFEVGRRHDLPLISILDDEGHVLLQGNIPFLEGMRPASVLRVGSQASQDTNDVLSLDGLDRFEARKRISALLEARELIEKVETTTHAVPHGDRSGEVLEPFLTDQWYVNAKKLAEPAIEAVRKRKTVFVPTQWEATFFNWMENIQPWCISRQIWWGHQIPAWYGRKFVGHQQWAQALDDPSRRDLRAEPEIFVASSETEAIELARRKYGCDIRVLSKPPSGDLDPIFQRIIDDELEGKPRWEPIWRDEDVLDTWFSSALWPFSTLGWPDHTPELARYYPTSVLVTGFDIIFFWVARMMMMGLQFMKQVPFPTVYIHALVRDERGQKMSKSKGNIIDPLEVIDEYGADALRFTLAAMAAQGRDIKLSAERVGGNRNFVTKLWNAARFGEVNGCTINPGFDPRRAKETLNQWIVYEVTNVGQDVTASLQAYKFNEAAGALYRFVWSIYCDWYLELIKPVLTGPDGTAKAETRAAAAWMLDEILKLLHPFMPFVSEELWHVTGQRNHLLALTPWPVSSDRQVTDGLFKRSVKALRHRVQKLYRLISVNNPAAAEVTFIIGLIETIRSARTEFEIPPSSFSLVRAINYSHRNKRLIHKYRKEILRLSRSYVDLFRSELVISDDPDVPEEIIMAARTQVMLDHMVLPYEEGQLLLHAIDRVRQKAKYEDEIKRLDSELARVDAKLGNPNFVARAPGEIVEEEKEKREAALARRAKIAEALDRLKGAA